MYWFSGEVARASVFSMSELYWVLPVTGSYDSMYFICHQQYKLVLKYSLRLLLFKIRSCGEKVFCSMIP